MNQKAGQTATSSVEKGFYKLLNNSNFGKDCRNSIDNSYLEPFYDDFTEKPYIKKFTTTFNDTFHHFLSPSLLRKEISQTFQAKIFALNKEDSIYEACKKYYERQMAEELDAIDTYEKIRECLDPRKTKMIFDFNDRESASIKSSAVKIKNQIKVTSRFMSGKLLMFAKFSLKSFIYDLVKTLYTFLHNLYLKFTKNTK